MTCTVGSFPEQHSPDYCWGGCPGALQEAVHIYRGFFPDVDRDMKRVRYVVGDLKGPLKLVGDEKVLFVGSCTRWEGEINGAQVKIQDSYKSLRDVDEKKTASNDMVKKISAALWNSFRKRNAKYIHIKGCPVSVADHVNYLAAAGRITNVNFDPRLFLPVTIAYWIMRVRRLMSRFGK